ncbi:MAG: pentapeptide repeat-containing protein [Cyanobacteria bacterium J06555_13]
MAPLFPWSRQSTRQLEQRIQAVPTWLVALISVIVLCGVIILVRGEPADGNPVHGPRQTILNTLLNDAEAIAIMVAVILYLKGAPDRKAQKHYEAWRVIDTAAAANVTTSYARYRALQDLHQDGVPLKWLEAPEANLTGISLPKADLQACNLSGTILEGANLRGANLKGANLSGADLSHADLVGCDLSGANLRSAVLRSAVMWEANLWEADLSGAELRWADLLQTQLKDTQLSETILPDGSVYEETVDVEKSIIS